MTTMTLPGLRNLLMWQKEGKPLPEGWERDTLLYIKSKRMDLIWKSRELKGLENDLKEARNIVWQMLAHRGEDDGCKERVEGRD